MYGPCCAQAFPRPTLTARYNERYQEEEHADGDGGEMRVAIPPVVSGASEQGQRRRQDRGGRLRKRKDGKTYVRRAKRRRMEHELPGEGQQRRGGRAGAGERLGGGGKRGWVT